MPSLSVVLSTYHGDDPQYLQSALDSVWEQTRTPDEIIIVKDGPVGEGIDRVVDEFTTTVSCPTTVSRLSSNQGHGAALRRGLSLASKDLVAIHDADDLCVSDRFDRQIEYLVDHPGVDVLGGTIAEFTDDPAEPHATREMPVTHEEIRELARVRSPVNQTTVMARRDEILEAGNYRKVDRMEDYDLWARMLVNGSRFANLPDVLVKVRAGEHMYERRGGFEYAREEIRQQRDFLRIGFVTPLRAGINVGLRVPVRVMPNRLRGFLYRSILRDQP